MAVINSGINILHILQYFFSCKIAKIKYCSINGKDLLYQVLNVPCSPMWYQPRLTQLELQLSCSPWKCTFSRVGVRAWYNPKGEPSSSLCVNPLSGYVNALRLRQKSSSSWRTSWGRRSSSWRTSAWRHLALPITWTRSERPWTACRWA